MSCLVCFKRPGRVVLATDSLFQRYGADGTRETLEAAKIRTAGRWRFAACGYTSHPGAPIDIFALVARTITPARTIEDAILTMAREISTPIGIGLEAMHKTGTVGSINGSEAT